MARKLRIEYAGAIYHVLYRRDRREPIFGDARDRHMFLASEGAKRPAVAGLRRRLTRQVLAKAETKRSRRFAMATRFELPSVPPPLWLPSRRTNRLSAFPSTIETDTKVTPKRWRAIVLQNGEHLRRANPVSGDLGRDGRQDPGLHPRVLFDGECWQFEPLPV